jgi:hypothetical protein
VSGGIFLFASPALNLPTYPWNLLGLVVALTGFIGFCPLYESVARLRRLSIGSSASGTERSGRFSGGRLRSAEH